MRRLWRSRSAVTTSSEGVVSATPKHYERSSHVRSVEHGVETVLLDLSGGTYFTLNEVGSRVWRALDHPKLLVAIVGEIASEFEAPVSVIDTDVTRLLNELIEASLVVCK